MLSPLFGSWKQPWACLLFSSTVFNMGHYYLYYYNYYFQHWAGTGTIPTEETCRQTPLVFCLDCIWEAKSFNSWQWKWQLKPTNRNIISLILIQTINNCRPYTTSWENEILFYDRSWKWQLIKGDVSKHKSLAVDQSVLMVFIVWCLYFILKHAIQWVGVQSNKYNSAFSVY